MNEQRPFPEFFTTGQIAEICHVTHRAVLKWVAKGRLKAHRTPGKHSRVHKNDLIAFLQEHGMPIPQGLTLISYKKRVLIVDDDPGIVHALQRLLMVGGDFEIATAHDGFAAGEAFGTFKPDLVILDIMMPMLDGYAVCQRIRQDEKNKHVRILCISGIDDPLEIKRMMDLGADEYLQKPFTHELMMAKVKKLCQLK